MSAPYTLVARKNRPTRIVAAGAARFGDGRFAVIAGPCSIESRSQLGAAAQGVCAAGAVMLRGGAYKTRTSPYDFQGLGDEGVALMHEAARALEMPSVVEALSHAHVDALIGRVTMIQIGARGMQNIPLLQHAARTGMPILLKRGSAATLDEVLCAAEYIALEGNMNIVLCERGIRGFDRHTRNVFDLGGALALKELTHLPVIADPSHALGRRDLIAPLTLAAAAAGLDGAIVEVHPQPAAALSDAAQAIDCETFAAIMARLGALRELGALDARIGAA